MRGVVSLAVWNCCRQIRPRRCGEKHRRKRLSIYNRQAEKGPRESLQRQCVFLLTLDSN
jgi:hypothetical protein